MKPEAAIAYIQNIDIKSNICIVARSHEDSVADGYSVCLCTACSSNDMLSLSTVNMYKRTAARLAVNYTLYETTESQHTTDRLLTGAMLLRLRLSCCRQRHTTATWCRSEVLQKDIDAV